MHKGLLSILLMVSVVAAQHAGAQSKVIAHRGYWKAEGAAQNSIASLRAAIGIGAYGSEFDVWVTSDGIAVINHDKEIGGNIIENSACYELRELTLSNGEKLPTLKEYLAAGAGQDSTRLILEIKQHSTKEANIRAAQIVLREVAESNVGPMVEYITFDLDAALEIIKRAPGVPVSYLNGDISPRKLKEYGFAGMDYNQKVYRDNPQWVDEAKSLGLTLNAWTVNMKEDMVYFIELGFDYITTDEPELLQSLLKEGSY